MEYLFKRALSYEEKKIKPFIINAENQSPDVYIILKDGNDVSRIDLYTGEGAGLYQKLIKVNDWIVIGCSYHVIWISKNYCDMKKFKFDNFSYFMDLTVIGDFIIGVFGDRLIKFDKSANIIWNSIVSIDGIFINQINENIIYCSCEMDPPGGWIDKKIDLNSGLEL